MMHDVDIHRHNDTWGEGVFLSRNVQGFLPQKGMKRDGLSG